MLSHRQNSDIIGGFTWVEFALLAQHTPSPSIQYRNSYLDIYCLVTVCGDTNFLILQWLLSWLINQGSGGRWC